MKYPLAVAALIGVFSPIAFADGLPPQTVTKVGTAAASAVTVQGNTSGIPFHTICDSGCGGASAFLDLAVFTAGTTAINMSGGVFDDTLAALTAGKAGAPRMTSKRALHFNLRDNAGAEIPFPAALAASGGMKVDVQNTSIAVTGTFWQATQPVSGTFWQTTQPVSGTFWQTTQPVSIASMPSTPVTGTFWQSTQPVSIASMPSTPVTGTFWQATQPVENAATTTAASALSQKTYTANTALNVKASAGNVYGWSAINAAASVCWLQFYNTAGTPTCGTSVVWSVPLPVTPGVSNTIANIPYANFATGIAICVSTTATGGTTCGSTSSGTIFFK